MQKGIQMNIAKALLFLMVLVPYNLFAQDDPVSAFLEKWDNSRDYLIAIAESMPAEQYDYRPTERQMTFGEQLLHIRENMLWLSHDYIAGKELEGVEQKDLSKEETVQLLSSSFDTVSNIVSNMTHENLAEKVDFFAGIKTRLQILNLIQDHVTHHRGQLIVYLNLQGIKPPDYVGW